jgi:hypothetical protein
MRIRNTGLFVLSQWWAGYSYKVAALLFSFFRCWKKYLATFNPLPIFTVTALLKTSLTAILIVTMSLLVTAKSN